MHAYHSTVISLMKFSHASLENIPHRNTQKHSNALVTLAIVNMYTCRYSEYVLQHEWGMKVLLMSVSSVVMAMVYVTVHWSFQGRSMQGRPGNQVCSQLWIKLLISVKHVCTLTTHVCKPDATQTQPNPVWINLVSLLAKCTLLGKKSMYKVRCCVKLPTMQDMHVSNYPKVWKLKHIEDSACTYHH